MQIITKSVHTPIKIPVLAIILLMHLTALSQNKNLLGISGSKIYYATSQYTEIYEYSINYEQPKNCFSIDYLRLIDTTVVDFYLISSLLHESGRHRIDESYYWKIPLIYTNVFENWIIKETILTLSTGVHIHKLFYETIGPCIQLKINFINSVDTKNEKEIETLYYNDDFNLDSASYSYSLEKTDYFFKGMSYDVDFGILFRINSFYCIGLILLEKHSPRRHYIVPNAFPQYDDGPKIRTGYRFSILYKF